MEGRGEREKTFPFQLRGASPTPPHLSLLHPALPLAEQVALMREQGWREGSSRDHFPGCFGGRGGVGGRLVANKQRRYRREVPSPRSKVRGALALCWTLPSPLHAASQSVLVKVSQAPQWLPFFR